MQMIVQEETDREQSKEIDCNFRSSRAITTAVSWPPRCVPQS